MASGPFRMPNERALTEKMPGLLAEAGLPDPEVTLAYHARLAALLYPSLDDQFAFGIGLLIALPAPARWP